MKKKTMNFWNGLSVLLLIVGGINWGLVGVFDFNLVTSIFGTGMFTSILYGAVGVAGLLKLGTWIADLLE